MPFINAISNASTASRLRILNLEPTGYSDDARMVLLELGDVTDGPLSRRALLERVSDYDVLIVRLKHQIDREVIEAGSRLKAIVSATTGLDHIDLATADSRQIAVLSLRGEEEFLRSITATAELTWGLLLALMRHIPEATASVLEGEWNRDAFRGRDVAGRRLGIVGLGRVGRQIAGYGAAFRMSVAAYDPYTSYWPPTVQRKDSLADLLVNTDVLTIHVGLHPGTVKLIARRELRLLPRGAILLNTSRGQIIDDEALVEALASGHLSGAALDVVPQERSDDERRAGPLITYASAHRNLLITPHIGGASVEAMARTEVFMARKLQEFLASLPLDAVS
jgi:D-3-phosphoglycerate dehydrogenase